MEIMIYRSKEEHINRLNPRPFFAMDVSNPEMRADGRTEKEAIERLKYLVRNSINALRPDYIPLKVVNIPVEEIFNEAITQEVVDS